MPRSFWGEVVISAAYLINRIPSNILNFQTSLQKLHHHIQTPHTPNLELRIFGCVVFVHLHDHQRSKLDPRAEKCVFIGYAPHQKGYRCYHPPSQKVYTSMNVVFQENDIYFSATHEEHYDTNTSQIFNFFPPKSSQPDNDRSTGRSLEATGLAVQLRRRKLMRFCPLRRLLQLQYHTNHLMRMSFR
ncbi:hypothetical protein L3X38_006728 [Prunus dulcis]|uniref:Retroviral polymerase SH3-like domain-containing protein n=1 Tax=Prunus dulcis TaxID=3755 RepID=A0AAD4ZTF1_PRUDU|nr:hypothetical protein L3X38_006728 [Prunus dulcis]